MVLVKPMNKRIRLTCRDNVVEEEPPFTPLQTSSKQASVKKDCEGLVEKEGEEERRKNFSYASAATAVISKLQNKLGNAEAEKIKLGKELTSERQNINKLKTELLDLLEVKKMEVYKAIENFKEEAKLEVLNAKAERDKLAEKLQLELSAERENTKNLKTQLTKEKDEAVEKLKEEAKMEVRKAVEKFVVPIKMKREKLEERTAQLSTVAGFSPGRPHSTGMSTHSMNDSCPT